MEFRCRNVNDAFTTLVSLVNNHLLDEPTVPVSILEEESRNGPVYSFEDPVRITYENPLERVLFNPGRDCNPFFHLVESLWMLAGRNDIATVAYFNEQMNAYSDDGITQHAAYGHRWRNAWQLNHADEDPYDPVLFPPTRATPLGREWTLDDPFTNAGDMFSLPFDQLQVIIDELKRDPKTRRLCLAMWQPADLALLKVRPECKDLPCNTHAHFRVTDGYLNITVYNRSNDMIWGTFGANAVQFSFLLEYLALSAGLKVGCYHQITNNLHIYQEKWTPHKWLKDVTDYYAIKRHDHPVMVGGTPPLMEYQTRFDLEVRDLIDNLSDPQVFLQYKRLCYTVPFLNNVACPMIAAFVAHKQRNYLEAQTQLSKCHAADWRAVGREWLVKREKMWQAKQGV